MADGRYYGGLFDNDELLWFIILFLLLFYCRKPFYGYGAVAPATC